MAEQTDPTLQKATLRKIINAASTAFLVTESDANHLHGRPMQTAQVGEQLDVFYFPTARDSGKVEELAKNPAVFLGYVYGNEWATVSGHGSIVDDRAKNREVWSELWKKWFAGPDDPKLVLIAVKPEQAEYWDNGTRVVTLAKMALTAATGVKTDLGEHAKVSL